MKKIILAIGILAAVVFGAFYFHTKSPVVVAPIVSDGYKNATYSIDGRNVTLVDGHTEEEIAPGSASKNITQYFGNEVRGDLNGDGKEDVAFLLTEDGGGSGTFYYAVVAFSVSDGTYAGSNAVFLGDRIAPQTTEIKNGELVVNYAVRASTDPMTVQPSLGVSKYLKVVNGELVEQK